MKTIQYILLGIFGILTMLSCKKGENDPFISLKTRDARITGVWELESSEEIFHYSEDSESDLVDETTTLTVEDGVQTVNSSFTITEDGSSETFTDDPHSNSYSETYSIEKNGKYTVTYITGEYSSERTGDWDWIDTAKKKTCLLIDGMIYQVDRLTNTELVLKIDANSKETNNPDNEEFLQRYSITKTFKKKK